MLIGSFLKNTNSDFSNRYFSGLSFNSADCKKDYIFLQLKEQSQTVVNSLRMQLRREQQQLFLNKNLKA